MLPGITPAFLSAATSTNDGFTKLLLHGDGVNLSTIFNDKSPAQHGNGLVGGNLWVGTGQSKFGGASILDSAGGYVTFPNHADWEFGAGDFTVDWWEYRAGAGTAICRGDFNAGYQAFMLSFSATRLCYMCSAAGAWDIANGRAAWGTVTNNVWAHLAITRQGNTFRAFKDGVLTDTWTSSLALMAGGGMPLTIGGAQGSYFNGYIDELRISKGIARWTANFTPPIAPYGPDPVITDGNDANTVLLVHADGVNNGAAFPDSSLYNHAITLAGTPVTSTAQLKFGSASALFVGGQGYRLVVPDHPALRPNGAFSVDFWMYVTSAAFQFIPICKANSSSYAPFFINGATVTAGRLAFYSSSNGGGWNIASAVDLGAYSLNTWTHVAVTWDGAMWRGFINGVQTMSFASAVLPMQNADPWTIGSFSGGNYDIPGYMDEVRISNGIARWTANFTPPAAPYGPPPLPATNFLVTMPPTAGTSAPVNVTVQARDAANNPTSNYSGAVHFTSTDGAAILPANSTLTGGLGIFPVQFKTTGAQTVTATDTVTGTINGTSGNVAVSKVRQFLAFTTAGFQTWTVPADWNNADNKIECIGGGGGGGNSAPSTGTGSGGGGAYARINNVSMIPGNVKNLVVGAGGAANSGNGTASWFRFDSGNTAPANTSQGVLAAPGGGGDGSTTGNGALGGQGGNCVGTGFSSGGTGGSWGSPSFYSSGGGGGAAGPNGNGFNGSDANGPGQGGAGGGGDNGGGGAGGGLNANQPGGNGAEWTLTAGGTVGSGGGPSGSNGGSTSGAPGLYGAGGWGGGNGGAGTAGARGLIVISYLPL